MSVFLFLGILCNLVAAAVHSGKVFRGRDRHLLEAEPFWSSCRRFLGINWFKISHCALFVLSLPNNLAWTELLSNYVLNSRVSDKIIAIYGPVQNNNCN